MSKPDEPLSNWVNPYWVIFLSSLSLVLLLTSLSQKSSSEICVTEAYELWPDLLKAKIRITQYASQSTITSVCGDNRSNACAIRRARWQRVTCEVYVLMPVDSGVLQHEMNHCRGWEHRGDSPAEYAQPWVPNWRLVKARGSFR